MHMVNSISIDHRAKILGVELGAGSTSPWKADDVYCAVLENIWDYGIRLGLEFQLMPKEVDRSF